MCATAATAAAAEAAASAAVASVCCHNLHHLSLVTELDALFGETLFFGSCNYVGGGAAVSGWLWCCINHDCPCRRRWHAQE